MTLRSTSSSPSGARHLAVRALACLGAGALAAGSLVLATVDAAGAAAPPLKSANIPDYAGVLENSSSHSLYLLSTEKGSKLHCTGACASIWIPLVVRTSVKKVTAASAVKGKIGFVKRTSSSKQVTFNTYPVYTYTGDTGPNQSTGEGVAADGGVWHLLHASSKSAGSTPYATTLNAANIPATSYKGVLVNSSSHSLYVLSAEKGTTLKCTASCLKIWPPLLVTASTTKISLGGGVDGTIGFVARGAMKQVTFNSYPVYAYTGDNTAVESCGQGLSSYGGTWSLTNAAATTPTATPVTTATGGCGTSYGYGVATVSGNGRRSEVFRASRRHR
jgi:predicted lipoprotein with Yx(FWY)xxD motif